MNLQKELKFTLEFVQFPLAQTEGAFKTATLPAKLDE